VDDRPRETARRWLDGEAEPWSRPDAALDGDAARVALGWALKELGYEALYRDAARGRAAVACLQQLQARCPSAPVRAEIEAACAWLQGAERALAGDGPAAIALLDQARRALLALGRGRDAAATQVPKLVALSLIGRHDDAVVCAEQALAELAAAGDEPAAGRVEINLGSMLLRQHRYAEAARHYRQAGVRFARVRDHTHSVMADVGLAGALAWTDDLDEAERIYERAEARMRAHDLGDLKGVVHGSRGQLELRRGRHAAALRWLVSALAEFERRGSPQRLAEARRDLADAYLALNLLPEAVALYDQAIEACRERQAPMEQAWATMQRALALWREGRSLDAQQGLGEAQALFLAHRNEVGAARASAHLAELALGVGVPARALERARSAQAALAAAGMQSWSLEARLLEAEAQVALDDHDAAVRTLQSVLAQAAGLPDLQARAHAVIGRLRLGQGDAASARQALEQAASLVESQRARLQADEFRTAYAADKLERFELLAELALRDRGAAADLRLFEAIERMRARALEIAASDAQGRHGLDGGLRQRLHWLQHGAQQAALLGQADRASDLAAQARALETEAAEARRRSLAGAAAQRATVGVGAPASAAHDLASALQAALRPDQALVEYARIGQTWVALVVRCDAIQRVKLPVDELPARIEQLRFQVGALRHGAPALRRHEAQLAGRARVHLQALHRQLWMPLLPWLEGASHVVVVPHGVLHYVPFCALDDGAGALVERHAVSLAPSARMWSGGRQQVGATPHRVLAVGLGGESLPHVREEVRTVAAEFGPSSTVLLDDAATLAAVRAALDGIDVLHLACHGQFRADNPAFSSLHLADGPLTLLDAAALPLERVAVTLSACETGMSRVAPGDEIVGLVRGFLLAGAASVLATLWTVEDACTAALMAHYYRWRRAGVAAPAALQRAQCALREEHPHPAYWAPFALHGRD
jgi:CHAT domain-containing protein/tetratricopeptide (TPR) repeat protein